MWGGALDGTRCLNDGEIFLFKAWNDEDILEESIVRVPDAKFPGREWCFDRKSLQEWFVERGMKTNPATGAPFDSVQLEFLSEIFRS